MEAIKNFAKVEVSTGYTAAATEVVLASGEGAKLPDPATDGEFRLVWYNSSDYADPADDPNVEISKVTARSADTLTLERPAAGNDYLGEGSDNTAQDHNTAGKIYKMVLALTKKTYEDPFDYADGKETASAITRETPSGTVDGSNTAFTLANTPITGTEQVYLNGVLQDEGASDDYTISGATITFNTAPQSGDKILVSYLMDTGTYATGSTSFVYNETPTGTVDGSNAAFTLANTPVSGSEMVFRDGQLMKGGGADYSISGAAITFTTAPVSGSVILVSYQQSVSVAGNADTLDGQHGSYYTDYADTGDDVAKTTAKAGAYLSSDQAIATGSWTKVPLDTELYDPGSNFDIANNRFVAPATGFYLVTCSLVYSPTTADKRYFVAINKNGAATPIHYLNVHASHTGSAGACISAVVYLTEGQYVEMYTYHDAGVSRSVVGSSTQTFMTVHRLS